MISTILGITIASFATVSLLTIISLSDKIFKESGSYPLQENEKKILNSAGYKESDYSIIQNDLDNIIDNIRNK
tara:strand:- start:10138 stop:10356 length:219 start_codon:yes stop_codon:yes gene_type:complete